ncbi:Glycyl-tRNA synthetase beta chain [uncultured Candidatus Thioglobus sp.]|nr:Glycyl-tRNA synthetase beta chain [uncultured Candidatus Thioglobus sp.]
MSAGLKEAELKFLQVTHYATPRRLSVLITGLSTIKEGKYILKKGPAKHLAYDKEGQPTPQTLGFAKSCGVEPSALEIMQTANGSWLAYRSKQKNQATIELLPKIAEQALANLPIRKKMRWGNKNTTFVRPVHWVVAIFGQEIVDCQILNIVTSNKTFGHRFHHPQPITLRSANSYLKQLEKTGKVIADYNKRKTLIRNKIQQTANKINGVVLLDEQLLDEVNSLVEWPIAILGKFEPHYLTLPKKVLIAAMQDHQKYFPVLDKNNNLLPYFISIINIDSKSEQVIREGNQRVLTARLHDANFFYQQDNKISLAKLRNKLKKVIFHEKLGNLYDKSERITALATSMVINFPKTDEKLVRRAGELSKCDLLTYIVGEFPTLQGSIGNYYAIRDGECTEVAIALEEQYLPRFAGDAIAKSEIGKIISIVEKMDSLVGMFAIGEIPTGNKDPFALRRSAIGILRTIIEGELSLNVATCLKNAVTNYDKKIIGNKKQQDTLVAQIFNFMMGRLRNYYTEQGIEVDHFSAVLAQQPEKPYNLHQRLQAVVKFLQLPQAKILIVASKRITNILKSEDRSAHTELKKDRLIEPSEQQLAQALATMQLKIKPLLDSHEYVQALNELISLTNDINRFFDEVKIMCDDQSLRQNRLTLLQEINRLFLNIADLSKLQVVT